MASSRDKVYSYADALTQGGLSGVLFSEQVGAVTRLSQGCSPIGPQHVITEAQRNIMMELDGTPALDVLAQVAGKGRCLLLAYGAGSSGVPPGWAAGPITPGINPLPGSVEATVREMAWGFMRKGTLDAIDAGENRSNCFVAEPFARAQHLIPKSFLAGPWQSRSRGDSKKKTKMQPRGCVRRMHQRHPHCCCCFDRH